MTRVTPIATFPVFNYPTLDEQVALEIEDSFEKFESGSFISIPDIPMPVFPAFFSIPEARKFCKNEICLTIMEEIAEKNCQLLAKDNFFYAFEQSSKDLDLYETLQALQVGKEVSVCITENPFLLSPRSRTEQLQSLEDLVKFWEEEKLLSLL